MECKRCLLSDDIQGVKITGNQCNYCDLHDQLERQYPKSLELFEQQIEEIRQRGKGSEYDCLIGISGGTDSSYMMHIAKQYGLRVLSFHFDNGWNTEQAAHNMRVMVEAASTKHVKTTIKQDIFNRVSRCFLMANVPDADIPNDIAMAKLMLEVAEAYGIKSILNGHSFRTEGSCPIGWTYMDGRYIRSVVKRYDPSINLKQFPLLWVWDQWRAARKGIKHYRILYHLDYTPEKARELLKRQYGWQDYGGHHCENDYTQFIGMYLYHFHGIDKRRVELSAYIRSGLISKQQACKILDQSVFMDGTAYNKVLTATGDINTMPGRSNIRQTFRDFKTYKQTFEALRPLIWLGVKLKFLPQTFYAKYAKR